MPQSIPIFDGHNDVLLRLDGNVDAFFHHGAGGHLDLPRARQGGMAGGFYAVFIPHDPRTPAPPDLEPEATYSGEYCLGLPQPLTLEYAQRYAMRKVNDLLCIEERSHGTLKIVRTAAEIEECIAQDVHAAILHFEGAEPIDRDLEALRVFHAAGLRSLGIVWSRPNVFGHGVPFAFPSSPNTGPGLTDPGRHLVQACNDLGIIIDLSHITEKGFWDVANLTNVPLVVTHASAHALCPSSRNLTDEQLDTVAESGGVVGVNFHVSFLRKDGKLIAQTPLGEIVRHIEYMVERMGVEHTALGSDFDGACIPAELASAAGLPLLIDSLAQRGFTGHDLQKLARENWLRVIRATWR